MRTALCSRPTMGNIAEAAQIIGQGRGSIAMGRDEQAVEQDQQCLRCPDDLKALFDRRTTTVLGEDDPPL